MGLPLFRVTPPPLISLTLRIMFPSWVCIKPEPENLIACSLAMLIVPPFVVSAIAPACSVPVVISPWRLSRLKVRCPSYSVFRLDVIHHFQELIFAPVQGKRVKPFYTLASLSGKIYYGSPCSPCSPCFPYSLPPPPDLFSNPNLNPRPLTFFNQPRRNFSRTHHPRQPRTRMRSRPHKIEIRNILTPIMRAKPSRLGENWFYRKRTA